MSLSCKASRRRINGVLLIVLGVFALSAPLATGRWSIAILGLPLIALSAAEAYEVFASPRRSKLGAYLPSLLAMLAGNALLLSSAFVLTGLLIVLSGILVVDASSKFLATWGEGRSTRLPLIINGLVDLGSAGLLWYLSRKIGIGQAIGIIVGGYIAAAGWRMLMAPPDAEVTDGTDTSLAVHPDARLVLPPDKIFADLRAEANTSWRAVQAADFMWMLTLGAVFLAIHIGRMPMSDTLLGRSSPFVATAGDLLMTLIVAMLALLPYRLLWRRLTRPIERLAWSLHLGAREGMASMNPAADWLVGRWLESRFWFTIRLREGRNSISAALTLLLRLGLPVTAFFVAFNPAWGFSWYFNTESWATGIYQKLTELRVDSWRLKMVDGVKRVYGSDGDDLFRINPKGVEGGQDFSFLVIGDPGEGDPSQYSLASSYLKLGLKDAVKFLVISSDVIYPAGAIEDYEANFHLPFQGFAKPIYAIPGNHDWYDALEAFNANFLEPKAARAAIEARVEADLGLTSTNTRRIDKLMTEAGRLRRLYGIDVGKQRGPYFELQTEDFALLAIDTGILRTVDKRQWEWIERALGRSQGKFTMAIVGHPRFPGGRDTAQADEADNDSESAKSFAALYRLLEDHDVRIAMAGDTHDFEYYAARTSREGAMQVMHHFVNGGGGAYLSIGTALDFPKHPATPDWAFYPRTDQLRAKLDAEMPVWKRPFWYWIKWFNAWPVNVETLSGLFDFNHAPFFQSFVEVRVERSRRRLVLALIGVQGPLHWRDLEIGGTVIPSGTGPEDPVEFVVQMR